MPFPYVPIQPRSDNPRANPAFMVCTEWWLVGTVAGYRAIATDIAKYDSYSLSRLECQELCSVDEVDVSTLLPL